MVRYRREDEVIADAIRTTRRSSREANRPTGTEKALTMETAEQAAEQSGEAISRADEAAAKAAEAKMTADGRNRIYAQMIEPVTMPELPFVPGDVWYRLDTEGRIAEVRVWNGTLWNGFQLVAGSLLVPGSVGNVLIADGAVTGQKIAADAIDGKTITGALFRTAATGQRMQFDSNGLRAFDGSNVETARLSSDGSGLRLLGPLVTVDGAGDAAARLDVGVVELTSNLLSGGWAKRTALYAGGLTTNIDSALGVTNTSNEQGTSVVLTSGNTPSTVASLVVARGADNGYVNVVAGQLRVNDRPIGERITPTNFFWAGTGFTIDSNSDIYQVGHMVMGNLILVRSTAGYTSNLWLGNVRTNYIPRTGTGQPLPLLLLFSEGGASSTGFGQITRSDRAIRCWTVSAGNTKVTIPFQWTFA